MAPNLFRVTYGSLSTSQFLVWLLSWGQAEYKDSHTALYQTACDMASLFCPIHKVFGSSIRNIRVFDNTVNWHIRLLITNQLNQSFLVSILTMECKPEHLPQLDALRCAMNENLAELQGQALQQFYINGQETYLDLQHMALQSAEYRQIPLSKLLSILAANQDGHHPLVTDFRIHHQLLLDARKDLLSKTMIKWADYDWLAFYLLLQSYFPDLCCTSQHNVVGSRWYATFGLTAGSGERLCIQLTQRQLWFIRVGRQAALLDEQDKVAIRQLSNQLLALTAGRCPEVQRPETAPTYSLHYPLAVVEPEEWLCGYHSCVDIETTVQRLTAYQSLLNQVSDRMVHR